MEKLVSISDVHIEHDQDPISQQLIRFMENTLKAGDKFFIVGDFFDVFVGNKEVFKSRHQKILEKMIQLPNRGVAVFYIEGNHDFLLKPIFRNTQITVLPENFSYTWKGKKIHFCHGDRINQKDYLYLSFRSVIRSVPARMLIDVVPGKWISQVGSAMSHASYQNLPDPQESVIKMFRNYACETIQNGFDFVVLGHSHYLDNMRFRVNEHSGQYVNVGLPKKHRKYLCLQEDASEFTFENLDF